MNKRMLSLKAPDLVMVKDSMTQLHHEVAELVERTLTIPHNLTSDILPLGSSEFTVGLK